MRINSLTRAGFLASTALAGAFAPAIAHAQGATDTGLEEIVVTAQKREQQVQDVPIAISAYSGEFLERFGATEMKDIGNLVPGLEIQEQSPNNPGFVIRGITSDSGQAFAAPRVSVFQDGVSLSRARGAVVQPFDLERVEVLRGPQGTLFGRNTIVGAVLLNHNKPAGYIVSNAWMLRVLDQLADRVVSAKAVPRLAELDRARLIDPADL